MSDGTAIIIELMFIGFILLGLAIPLYRIADELERMRKMMEAE